MIYRAVKCTGGAGARAIPFAKAPSKEKMSVNQTAFFGISTVVIGLFALFLALTLSRAHGGTTVALTTR
jgi:hypothetical protein